MTRLELLAPARNADYGKAAIVHGADAVYIGAPRFGARAVAGNSVGHIESLTRFSHLYRAKVYATINTIIYDNEIEEAVRLMWQLYEAGVDAFIIQDMGLLQYNSPSLPPLPLHASTQAHNASLERIRFLEQVGFKRVILARELSLDEIRNIRSQTEIELECFVHGALCVSYSGQCYLSQVLTGRSGNRGECAQPCRSAYQLISADKQVLVDKAHLLSLKDLNLSAHLDGLVQSGITSFKIEGRLKDLTYLKNITAFYRSRMDALMEGRPLKAASSGKTVFFFTPDPEKTFHRSYTDYFIGGRAGKVGMPATQKSTGERIGKVTSVQPTSFTVNTQQSLHAGDGLCWLTPQRGLEGTSINRIDGQRIFPAKPVTVTVGTSVFRNNDFLFVKQLSGDSAERRIDVKMSVVRNADNYVLTVEDEDGNRVIAEAPLPDSLARQPEQARTQMIRQLQKLGNTAFSASEINIADDFDRFVTAAELNALRRKAVDELAELRIVKYWPQTETRHENDAPFPEKVLDYHANMSNAYARAFYEKYGATVTEPALELQAGADAGTKELMCTKHCIRWQYDACPKQRNRRNHWPETLYLRNNHTTFRLEFDCKTCVMRIYQGKINT